MQSHIESPRESNVALAVKLPKKTSQNNIVEVETLHTKKDVDYKCHPKSNPRA